jgi:peptide/nickel transport system permease protein
MAWTGLEGGRPATASKPLRVLARNKRTVLSGLIVLLAVLGLLLGPYLMPYDPNQPNVAVRLNAPSLEHWMGTDRVGRDLFSRVLAGLGVTMKVAIGAVVFAVVLGVPLGAISGYVGRWFDVVVMRVMDAIITFPSRLLAIALVAASGPSIWSLWFAIGFHEIPRYARLIRGGVLAQKEREYVEAARATGEGSMAILFRHIFPNAMAPVMVQVSLSFAHAITAESALSFLGLGLAPPTISWGQMLNEAQSYMESAPWTAFFPGLTLSIAVLGFTLFGDGLRDIMDPRQKRR